MTDPALSTLIDAARRRPSGRKLCRTVVRLDPDEVARLDALRARLPKSSRSALVRAMTLWALATLEAPEGGAP